MTNKDQAKIKFGQDIWKYLYVDPCLTDVI